MSLCFQKLITKVEDVKREKEKLAIDLEMEEEFLTNNLQRQLNSVRGEKEETEHEVAALKRQLELMKQEREKVRILFDIVDTLINCIHYVS